MKIRRLLDPARATRPIIIKHGFIKDIHKRKYKVKDLSRPQQVRVTFIYSLF